MSGRLHAVIDIHDFDIVAYIMLVCQAFGVNLAQTLFDNLRVGMYNLSVGELGRGDRRLM